METLIRVARLIRLASWLAVVVAVAVGVNRLSAKPAKPVKPESPSRPKLLRRGEIQWCATGRYRAPGGSIARFRDRDRRERRAAE